MRFWNCFMLTAACLLAAPLLAKNVDLSTIPPRDTVQLTIYNSEDITLVRETRTLTFKRGVNPLQFSWANTLIDPSSVELAFKTHDNALDLLDTTFPHDKPQMLYWSVRSEFDGDATVEITYFTSGITWAADYVCVSDPAETSLHFGGYVKITNNSGEDYADAQIRLVVGTINLVEKVRELAEKGLVDKSEQMLYLERRINSREFKDARARGEIVDELQMRAGLAASAPREIIKEGLSEYFIYTIDGVETVKHAWSKRMRLFEGQQAPFEIKYRYRPAEYGDALVRLYILRNDAASDLGTTPLPDGMLRLYRDNGRDGLSVLVRAPIKYVPIGQEIVMNLGADPEVIHERVRVKSWRENFWFHRHNAQVHYSPREGHKIRTDDDVIGWEDHDRWIDRIRNYRGESIEVEIRRRFDGHAAFHSDLDPTRYDFRTVQFSASVAAGQRVDLPYRIVTHQGSLSKQSSVTLVPGE